MRIQLWRGVTQKSILPMLKLKVLQEFHQIHVGIEDMNTLVQCYVWLVTKTWYWIDKKQENVKYAFSQEQS